MEDVKAVIFDFDGTLVDYRASDREAIYRVGKMLPKVDIAAFYEKSGEVIMNFHALVEQKMADPRDMHYYRLTQTLKHFGLQWQEDYLTTYLDHFYNSSLVYSGSRELLDQLKATVPLALLTNAYDGEEQRLRIQHSGLASFFQVIAVSGDIGHYKPEPEAFWYVTDKLKVKPQNCLYVGDSEIHDIQGAKEAGLMAIKILHREQRARDTSAADLICPDFQTVGKILVRGCVSQGIRQDLLPD